MLLMTRRRLKQLVILAASAAGAVVLALAVAVYVGLSTEVTEHSAAEAQSCFDGYLKMLRGRKTGPALNCSQSSQFQSSPVLFCPLGEVLDVVHVPAELAEQRVDEIDAKLRSL